MSRRPNLVDAVFEAHGGLDDFDRIYKVILKVERFGTLWRMKGYAEHTTATIMAMPHQ